MNIRWNYTTKLVNDLLTIDKVKALVELLELPISIEKEIKKEITIKRVKDIYENKKSEISILDTLDKRERWVANYIATNGKIKAKDIANYFNINLDTANNWIKKWIEKDFLVRLNDKQIRNVDYTLSTKYYNQLKISRK